MDNYIGVIMGSLSDELKRNVYDVLETWIINRLTQNLKEAALPGFTGALSEGVQVRHTGDTLQVVVTGPAAEYAYKWEFGFKADPSATHTSTYTRRSRSGQLQRITRTYTGGQKPHQVPKKMGGGGDTWRVYAEGDSPGSGKFQQAFIDTMEQLAQEAGRILPRELEITSLD